MKTLATMALLLLSSVGMTATTADTLTVRVKGMRCDECAHKVKTVLRKDAGIVRAGVDIRVVDYEVLNDPTRHAGKQSEPFFFAILDRYTFDDRVIPFQDPVEAVHRRRIERGAVNIAGAFFKSRVVYSADRLPFRRRTARITLFSGKRQTFHIVRLSGVQQEFRLTVVILVVVGILPQISSE